MPPRPSPPERGPAPPRAAGRAAPPSAGRAAAPSAGRAGQGRPGGATGEQPTPGIAPVRFGPARRLLSTAIGGFAAMLGVGIVFGAQTAGVGTARIPYTIVIFGIQVLFVLAFSMALRPPGIRVVAVAGLLAALVADVAAVLPAQPEITLLGYVAAAGVVAGAIGQLVRREGRIRIAESITATVVIVPGVVAFATLVLLTRLPIGTQAITVCLSAAGSALVVARLVDTVAPWPRLAPHLARGSLGVVLGAMLGTGLAAYLGSYLRGFEPTSAALIGLVTAVAAVLADLSVGYAEAGRRKAGDPPTMWIARHLQGPLAGFGLAAPLAYLLSAIFFVPRYF